MEHGNSACGAGRGHDAVARLFELARAGDTASDEYQQLDSLVFDGLLRTYGVQAESSEPAPILKAA